MDLFLEITMAGGIFWLDDEENSRFLTCVRHTCVCHYNTTILVAGNLVRNNKTP
jgi:hypothetical protein